MKAIRISSTTKWPAAFVPTAVFAFFHANLRATQHRTCWLVFLLLFGWASSSPAVLFYATADPNHNTTPPTGTLTNSGWQYQGTWKSFLGTPVAPHYFLAASHVGGAVGDIFHFRGVDYTTTALFDDTNSDLRVWQVCGTFPDYAPLYSGSSEARKTVVVFGRGTQRGAEVVSSGVFSSLKGWQWGPADGVQRWGVNVVGSIINGDTGLPPLAGGGGGSVGDVLKCDFDASGGPEEADLSTGDSSGGVFIQDGSVWKLAGINYAVDGPYNTNSTGAGFQAAIFDEGGLYTGGEGNWQLQPDLPVDQPGAFYATRVSAHLDWINSVIQNPVTDVAPVLQSTDLVQGPYHDVPEAAVDTNAKTVTVTKPATTQFYRLRACDSKGIDSIRLNGSTLIISYQ